MKIYHYHWVKYDWRQLDPDFKNPKHVLNGSDCYGLYYITGNHYIYGKDVLLYFGKAQEQKFGIRFSQHDDFDVTNIPKINDLYIGRLLNRDNANNKEWSNIISITEKMFINAHIPAMNASNVKYLLKMNECEDIIVLNWGEIGCLLPEISGLRFSDKYWDSKKYEEKYLSD